jgi:hypothetical protein
MMTDEDVEDFNRMLTKFKAQNVADTKVTVGDLKVLLDDRLDKLQKVMFDQFRNKGDL